jgi:acetate CoA/acetoacetate CoA-transferase beta subunit
MHVFFQSENGLIGTGAPPQEGMAHPTLTDAGGRPVTALPGACTFDSAMSFGLIRGGHLDLTVLGGLQVDQEGHLANWMIPGKKVGHGRGHGFGDGRQARRCGNAAHRQGRLEDREEMHATHHVGATGGFVVTELAVIAFPDSRATLLETGPGISAAQVGAATQAELAIPDVPEMTL